jgi:methyl-accepting chemotaxis protein
MKGIAKSRDRISLAHRVAGELAFQADLLVLHAAVEASRAGETGTEFTAAATTVRNLARYGAQAAAHATTRAGQLSASLCSDPQSLRDTEAPSI